MKTDDDKIILSRFLDLRDRAHDTYSFWYSQFHSLHQASLAYSAAQDNEIKLYGGYEGCERVIVRFGDERLISYEEEFPITLIVIRPKAPKFADKLTHRDYLGAILNLGIDRSMIGDIIVKDNIAYVFALDTIANFIVDSLSRVKHTSIVSEISKDIPKEARVSLKPCEITVSSERLDAIIAKLFHLSRNDARSLFMKEAVFADGKAVVNAAKIPADDTVISVRGYGKFIFRGMISETRKKRIRVLVEVYS